jgi:hypothetical protein
MPTAAIDFDRAWAQTEVRVVSPNEQVFLTILGNAEIRVSFAPGYVERTSYPLLVEQLVRLGRAAFAARTRSFYALRSEEAGQPVEPGTTGYSEQSREYFRRLAELAAEGTSADGSVRVTAVGMTEFAVAFPSSLLDSLGPAGLAARLGEAATALMHDQLTKVARLKLDVYYPGLLR